LYFYGFFFISV